MNVVSQVRLNFTLSVTIHLTKMKQELPQLLPQSLGDIETPTSCATMNASTRLAAMSPFALDIRSEGGTYSCCPTAVVFRANELLYV